MQLLSRSWELFPRNAASGTNTHYHRQTLHLISAVSSSKVSNETDEMPVLFTYLHMTTLLAIHNLFLFLSRVSSFILTPLSHVHLATQHGSTHHPGLLHCTWTAHFTSHRSAHKKNLSKTLFH